MFRLITLFLLLPVAAAAGEIYQCTAPDGLKSFQGTPCPTDTQEEVKELKPDVPPSNQSLWASAAADGEVDPEVASCRDGVMSDYRRQPKVIEAEHKQRRRQCRENFNDGSDEIKECYQAQEDILREKVAEMEEEKKQQLASCDA